MTASASLPDDELVRLARGGQRDAFAVLYHRYVRQVHDLAATGSPDATAAEKTTVGVFCDLLRHLHEIPADGVAATLEHHTKRRTRGHTRGTRVPTLTVGTVDGMWREIDRRWPSGDAPRRDMDTIVPITAGALVAVLFLGTLASTTRRSGVGDPDRSFEAVHLQEEPELFPTIPGPGVTAAEESTPDREATVALPTAEPTLAPSEPPSETATPVEQETEPAPTEEPDAAPEVTINSPDDGATLTSDGRDDAGAYATVTVDGVAVDDRDGPDALTYSWGSSIDGPLADAPTATVRLHVPDSELTATHVLTFSATDSAGNSRATSVTVVVTRV
ncbi:MAG: hypothetical protein KY457_04205 [Actinobacteria bacterium]|nr:hypothetical protein [Actinomycetota bacterium]